MTEEQKKLILDFLRGHTSRLGVVSTVSSKNTPESAFVYYSFDNDLNLYFMTRAESRKAINLRSNNHVSYVVASENPPQTLQVEGEVSWVDEPEMQKVLFKDLVEFSAKNYFSAPIAQMPNSELIFLKISPNWMRFGNFEIRREGDMFLEETTTSNVAE